MDANLSSFHRSGMRIWPRIPHTKPKGDDQPDKRQAGRETKTKSIDNPEQIQDFQSTIVTWPSKVTHRQMEPRAKET